MASPAHSPVKSRLKKVWPILFVPMILSLGAALAQNELLFTWSIITLIPCSLIWGISMGTILGTTTTAKVIGAILLSIAGICFSLAMVFAGCSLILSLGGNI